MHKFRTDIQGMRAIAVILVLVFHVFPALMPGGYIGVDIFFVISGFLICGLILKGTERDGKFDAIAFYGKRIRRLLPAATLVLILSAVIAYFVLPQTRWADTGREIIASTLYVENLYLHFQSTNYLTADKPASPLQHFWSLSVEEQFYIFWPIIMLVMVFISKYVRISLRALLSILLILIFAASLASSIYITDADPAAAYFVTHTRIWELALGGALACLAPYFGVPAALRTPLSIMGLLMILITGYLYSVSTPFPGYMALIPTLGVAVLLWAGMSTTDEYDGPVQKVLSLKPLTYIGDISYSLYLWHWPLVIFAIVLFGSEMTAIIGLAVIGMSVLAAAASTHLLENPLRNSHRLKSKVSSYLLGTFFMALSIIAGLLLILVSRGNSDNIQVDNPPQIQSDYPGAAAIGMPVDQLPVTYPAFIPSLEDARKDIATVYTDKCHTQFQDVEPTPCIYIPIAGAYGQVRMEKRDRVSDETTKTVVIVGDSHAAQWLPTLKEIAKKRNWTLVSYTKSSCAFNKVVLMRGRDRYDECQVWGSKVQGQIIALNPDLVVAAQIFNHNAFGAKSKEESHFQLAAGAAAYWNELGQNSIPVAALAETPRFDDLVPDCIAANLPNWSVCNVKREAAFGRGGSVLRATKLTPTSAFVDMTENLCMSEVCPVIIGNVLVYRDQHHLTATYARTLAPALETKLISLIEF
ncbi:acyltransferase family protein [Robiginitomaculum antarcticum]|uniref:acyltransferase family protein n=1 Tax=Robiginitomaculum antarcticum TaxID=437507 RepID=UPI000684C7A6|nr:acyltransferase family protein [Robiginitomaculum antarcticum]